MSELRLIRLDHTDPIHLAEFARQRQICGWSSSPQDIAKWMKQVAEGSKVLYWVFLAAEQQKGFEAVSELITVVFTRFVGRKSWQEPRGRGLQDSLRMESDFDRSDSVVPFVNGTLYLSYMCIGEIGITDTVLLLPQAAAPESMNMQPPEMLAPPPPSLTFQPIAHFALDLIDYLHDDSLANRETGTYFMSS